MMAHGNSNASVFSIDKQCLTNFLGLVKEHFDVHSDTVDGDFGAKDLLSVIRVGGQTNSRIAFQKALLIQLETQLQAYCDDLINNLKKNGGPLVKSLDSCKVRRDMGKGQNALTRRWSLAMPIGDFEQFP